MITEQFIKDLVSTKSNRINTNRTRILTDSQKAEIVQFSGYSDINFLTAVYCVYHNLEPKKCKCCSKNLNIENFTIGYPDNKQYCSLICKTSYDPLEDKSGEICQDFSLLLDINGNPSTAKMNRYLNVPTIEYLKEKFNFQIDDKKTLLYAALHPDFKIHKCLECGSDIRIHNFQVPYRDNQCYCSIECKDKSAVYQRALGDTKRGVSRYENDSFVNSVSIPSFEKKKEFIAETYNVDVLTTFEDYISKDNPDKILHLKCQTCEFEFEKRAGYKPLFYCKICNKNRSSQQIEIAKYIISLGFEVSIDEKYVIQKKDIDIWIPSKRIGIEYDGFYWHDDKEDKEKWKKIRESKTRVIRIFEDEYRDKEDLVLSRINSILGLNNQKIYARKCNIREISDFIAKQFLNENHIQGYVPASIRYGLYHEDELVSVMTFGKSRFSNKYDYELMRYASKKYITIIGGASKLLKKFKEIHVGVKLVSYCDLRYSDGNLYEKLGFKFSHRSDSNYFYYGNKVRHSRVAFQKHKLKDKLKIYDESLSESKNMELNGYLKIWDCGNNVYEMIT